MCIHTYDVPSGDTPVTYPKILTVLATGRRMVKYVSGRDITVEELYNAEMEGSLQTFKGVWYLYDYKLDQVAKLSQEYIEFTGINNIEGLADIPSIAEQDEQTKRASLPEDGLPIEHPSYEEYLEYIFKKNNIKRCAACGRAGPPCGSAGTGSSTAASESAYCACDNVCGSIPASADGSKAEKGE